MERGLESKNGVAGLRDAAIKTDGEREREEAD